MCTTPHVADTAGASDTQIDGTACDMAEFDGICYVIPIIDSTGDSTDDYIQILGMEASSSGGTFAPFTTAFAVRGVTTAEFAGDDMLVIADYQGLSDRWQKPRITSTTGLFRGACIGIRYKGTRSVVDQSTGTDQTIATGSFASPTTA